MDTFLPQRRSVTVVFFFCLLLVLGSATKSKVAQTAVSISTDANSGLTSSTTTGNSNYGAAIPVFRIAKQAHYFSRP